MQDSFLFPFCPYLHLIHDVLEQISERIALLLQVRIVRLNLHLDKSYLIIIIQTSEIAQSHSHDDST